MKFKITCQGKQNQTLRKKKKIVIWLKLSFTEFPVRVNPNIKNLNFPWFKNGEDFPPLFS